MDNYRIMQVGHDFIIFAGDVSKGRLGLTARRIFRSGLD